MILKKDKFIMYMKGNDSTFGFEIDEEGRPIILCGDENFQEVGKLILDSCQKCSGVDEFIQIAHIYNKVKVGIKISNNEEFLLRRNGLIE